MKFQKYEWSCGPASVVNALRCFGIKVAESKVTPIAGTIPPSRCEHCKEYQQADFARTCKKSKWKCKCTQCKNFRRINRKDCVMGTEEAGMLAAIRYFGEDHLQTYEYLQEETEHAWQWLHGSLLHGHVAILCFDSWSHWVVVLAALDDRVIIFDPYPSEKNKAESGVRVLDQSQLMKKWRNGRKWVGAERRLYAILVGRKR